MKTSEKKIICITGLDGTGKNTLIENLKPLLPPFYLANIWDLLEGDFKERPFTSKREVDGYLCNLTSNSRLLFLAHALKFSIDKALQSSDNIIVVNGYFYKYFASELALNASENLVEALIQNFVKPNLVIELLLSPKVAAERKNRFSRYECGLSKDANANQFIDFQQKASPFWNNFLHTNWHKISTEGSEKESKDLAVNILTTTGFISQNPQNISI